MYKIKQFSSVFILTIFFLLSACNEKDIIIIDSYYQFWSGGMSTNNPKIKNKGTHFYFKLLSHNINTIQLDSVVINTLGENIDFNIISSTSQKKIFNQGDTITVFGSSYQQMVIPKDKSIKAKIYYHANKKNGILAIETIRKEDNLNYQ